LSGYFEMSMKLKVLFLLDAFAWNSKAYLLKMSSQMYWHCLETQPDSNWKAIWTEVFLIYFHLIFRESEQPSMLVTFWPSFYTSKSLIWKSVLQTKQRYIIAIKCLLYYYHRKTCIFASIFLRAIINLFI